MNSIGPNRFPSLADHTKTDLHYQHLGESMYLRSWPVDLDVMMPNSNTAFPTSDHSQLLTVSEIFNNCIHQIEI